MKTSKLSRALSLALALVMVFSLFAATGAWKQTAYAALDDPNRGKYAAAADDASLNAVPTWFAANTGCGKGSTFARIVDGEVFTWGQNVSGVLGYTSYTENGVTKTFATNANGINPSPHAIDQTKFGSKKVTFIGMNYAGAVAVNEDNDVYTWGNGWGGTTITKRTAAGDSLDGHTVKQMLFTYGGIYIKDENGDWHVRSGAANTSLLLGGTATTFTKVPDTFYQKLLRSGESWDAANNCYKDGDGNITHQGLRRIVQVASQITDNCMVLTDDGLLFMTGQQNGTHHPLGTLTGNTGNHNAAPACLNDLNGKNASGGTTDTTWGVEIPDLTKVKFSFIAGEDQGYAMVDTDGNVWGFGSSNWYRYGKPMTTKAGVAITEAAGLANNANLVKYWTTSPTGYGDSPKVMLPLKIFDAEYYEKKARRVWMSFQSIAVLCDDNTLYGQGRNANGMFNPNFDDPYGEKFATSFTQFFTNNSLADTLVGLALNEDSVMGLTKGGAMVFAGSNASGASGTGDTVDPDPGEAKSVQPSTLPPALPMTANEIFFELTVPVEEEGTDGKTVTVNHYYRPCPTKDGENKFIETDGNGTQLPGVAAKALPDMDVGTIIKLNVYFSDFGKLTSFIVPIRFNPDYVRVVNDEGEEYASSSPGYVSLGSLGGSGITQEFDSNSWSEGTLATSSYMNNSGYPKVSNYGGWVSVMGYSENDDASISGAVKMFSITFKTVMNDASAYQGDNTFCFATSDNDWDPTSDFGYDDAIGTEATGTTSEEGGPDGKYGPVWTMRNSKMEDVTKKIKVYALNVMKTNDIDQFPTVTTKLTQVEWVQPKLYQGATKPTQVTEVTTSDDIGTKSSDKLSYPAAAEISTQEGKDEKFEKIYVLSKDTGDTYSVDINYSPEKASYPDMTWTASLRKDLYTTQVTDADKNGVTVDTYITMGEATKTGQYFTINATDDATPPAFIEMTGVKTTRDGINATAKIGFIIVSQKAPGAVYIQEQWNAAKTAKVQETVLYQYKNADVNLAGSSAPSYTFNATFPDGDQSPYKDVVWSLVDSEGKPVDSNAVTLGRQVNGTTVTLDGQVVDSESGDGTGKDVHKVTINVEHTLPDTEFLYLRATSRADSSKYDQIRIRVQLLATKIEFNPQVATMMVKSKLDLSSAIIVTPSDAVVTGYTWNGTVSSPAASLKPANVDKLTGADKTNANSGKALVYGTWGSGSNASVFSSAAFATNAASSETQYETNYVKFSVTENNSGRQGFGYINILDLDSPLSLDKTTYTVYNEAGTANDRVFVKPGANTTLKAGDLIFFYAKYSATAKRETAYNASSPITITTARLSGFTFNCGDSTKSMLSNTKGTIGVQAYQLVTEGMTIPTGANVEEFNGGKYIITDPVPVNYNPEPIKVQGYVRLMGRSASNDQNTGIHVIITNGKDVTAEADANKDGYFTFEGTYIAEGDYTLTIEKENYLTRYLRPDGGSYKGLTITVTTGQTVFNISTQEYPIYLYPGAVGSPYVIEDGDLTNYVTNWVGQTSKTVSDLKTFKQFDFYDTQANVINHLDLELMLSSKHFTSDSYPTWTVPKQK